MMERIFTAVLWAIGLFCLLVLIEDILRKFV